MKITINDLPQSLNISDENECILPIYTYWNGYYEPVKKISFKNLVKAIESSSNKLVMRENKDKSISFYFNE